MNDSEQHRPPGGDAQLRYPLPPGTRVDHYIIREVLGAGGFGITYLAEHEGLGKQYAIKEYFPHAFSYRHGLNVLPSSTGDGTYKWGLERFVTEARALAKFKHPAIVDVTSIFEANGTAYIVLGYEAGHDMIRWLKELGRPPSQEELDNLLVPLLSALDEIHRHNMMHRDISPDNLLVRDDGRPVLIDFGSARESIRGRARALSAIVKHGYSPPEQYSSKPELQGPWTDIYALAATLHRAISGKLPPDATERLVRDDLQPLSRLARAPYRQAFLEAIDHGLRMKAEERPQSVVEWREMLLEPGLLRQPLREPDHAGARMLEAPPPGGRLDVSRPAEEPPASHDFPVGSRLAAQKASLVAGSAAHPMLPQSDGSRASQRVGMTTSIPKSERPDLSWLDETDEPLLAEDETPPPSLTVAQAITYAFLGLIGGAVLGGMLSIVLASIVSTECFADQCIFRYLTICSAIGAVAGVFAGLHFARQVTAAAETRPPLGH